MDERPTRFAASGRGLAMLAVAIVAVAGHLWILDLPFRTGAPSLSHHYQLDSLLHDDLAGGSDPAQRLSALPQLRDRHGAAIGIRTLELRWRCIGLRSYGAATSSSRCTPVMLRFDRRAGFR
jgi:hypothetical protein